MPVAACAFVCVREMEKSCTVHSTVFLDLHCIYVNVDVSADLAAPEAGNTGRVS